MKKADLTGPPNECLEEVKRYLEAGVTHFVLHFREAPSLNGMQMFAKEIISKLRVLYLLVRSILQAYNMVRNK